MDSMDTGVRLDPADRPEKVDIASYVSPIGNREPRGNHAFRSSATFQMAQMQEDGEGEKSHTAVRPKHIVKIFTSDDDFIEVNPEQVDRVKMMHDRFETGVKFSFNYGVLLFVASVLAGLGLVSNGGTTVIASMLVSPIMGPVVGLAYGTTIHDWKLVRLSLRNECISLLCCITIGVIVAAVTGLTDLAKDWITDEMQSRASLQNFLVALPVAFFSGLGVAVSLLDDQTSSLVGVAISASLLPPAVNAGILFIYHAYVESGRLEPLEEHEHNFSSNIADNGVMSLFVTIANILLIWMSSMLMFRMKEVLPIEKKVFWDDLGVARKIYRKRALLQVYEGGNEMERATSE